MLESDRFGHGMSEQEYLQPSIKNNSIKIQHQFKSGNEKILSDACNLLLFLICNKLITSEVDE